MRKLILIINLIVKTLVELIIVCTFGVAVGIITFAGVYIFKSINNAIEDYKRHSSN
tara:strand:+ start:22375 stop:22542 length:168 start_codon:yes stop_codon:yes gene_type:complete